MLRERADMANAAGSSGSHLASGRLATGPVICGAPGGVPPPPGGDRAPRWAIGHLQTYSFGQQNMPPNHITNVNPTGSIASLNRGSNRGPARPSTTKYHPYSKGSAGGASTVFEGKNAQREAERHQGTTTQREQHRSGMVKNQMGLAVPRDAKDETENDINRAAEYSPRTAFGDPIVSLSRPEAWVNEIMSQQFAGDPSVVFHAKGSSLLPPRAQSGWTFPFSRYKDVVKALKTESAPDAIGELAPTVVSTLGLSARIKDDSMRYGHIPPELEAKLMPFQRDGIRFILQRGGRALLGDEMGLGKTVQALGVASAYRDEWPVMIICPSSLRESWSAAIQEWLGVPEKRVRVVHSGKDAEGTVFGTFQFLVISYGFLDKIKDSGMFNIVVVDESHALKDWTAKRTKVALPILKKAKRVVLLTGTPALNRPKEIFTQLSAVAAKANLKLKDFGERYCEGSRWDKYAGSKNLGELFALLHSSVMVRRLKKDVLSELPRKRRQKVFLGLDATGKKQLLKLKEQMDESRAMLVSSLLSGKMGAIRDNGVIMEVYKKTAEVKIKAVQEYVGTLLEAGEKFLIFGHHIAILDAIEQACNRGSKSATGYIRIDGSTPAKQRADLVDDFQNNQDTQVAILSIKAAGVGLTLTAASTVVFAELTWVPGDLIQAEDRAHRIGQQNAVNVSFLMVKNSIDEVIWNTIEQKLEQLGECLNGEQQTMQVAGTTERDPSQRCIKDWLSQSQKGV
jgi:SWI/SNF-related matrix-associated actin-dependent regulator 1 of chromatin subfamily A